MLKGEHSAILLTFIKLPFVIKIFVLSIFEWLLKTGFTILLQKQSDLGQFCLSMPFWQATSVGNFRTFIGMKYIWALTRENLSSRACRPAPLLFAY